jgi:uncharacterized repeat protein (TIGR01451 family)/LPXTG-motif cell wall-anchored protein
VVTWPAFDLDGADGEVTVATFTVTVQVDDTVPAGVDALDNTATVAHPDDIDDTNDTDGATVAVEAVPDLVVTKTSGQGSVTAGSTLTYALEVRNAGDQGATGVTVTDTLPDGLTFADASDGGAHDAGVVTWDLVDELPAGGTVALTLTVTVDDPLPPGTTSLTNLVGVSDDGTNGPDPTPENNRDTDTVVTGADIGVTKSTLEPPVPGATVVYEIVVTNAGPETVRSLSLVDTLPPGVSDPVFAPEVGTYDPATAVWDGVVLEPGGSIIVRVTAQVSLTASGELTNLVAVMPLDHADPDPSDNRDDVTDPVAPVIDLVLDKQVSGAAEAGGQVDYELTVRNDGPSIATGVVLVDQLPAGLSVVTVDAEGWRCDVADSEVRCELSGSLEPGATTVVRLVVAIAEGLSGELVNVAVVSANEPDVDGTTNVSDAALVLPDLPVHPDPDPQPPTDGGDGELPATGAALRWLSLAALASLLGGLLLLWRRPERVR